MLVIIHIFNARQTGGVNPLFSWKLEGDEEQVSYRIFVKNRDGIIIWDSKEVVSGQRHNISCGVQLKCEEIYSWTVSVTGNNGSEDKSSNQMFMTEIAEWKAKWIEPERIRKPLTDSLQPVKPEGRTERPNDGLEKLDPPVYMRKCFELHDTAETALLYAAAHGIYAIWVNGELVTDLFAPGNTSYFKHIDYQIYDVTNHLKTGKNCIGVILADGWYTGKIGAVGVGQQYGTENAVLFQMLLKNKNSEDRIIVSDEEVKWREGALRYADLYIGEYYDANAEIQDWNTSEYDDGEWNPVRVIREDYEKLTRQSIPAIKETRVIQPNVLRSPKGELLLDAGENIVGYTSFTLDLTKGAVVSLEHSETVDKDGNYLQNIIGQNKNQTDYYVSCCDGVCYYKPQFTFHGFRYVRITGTDDANPEHYRIHVIETPLRETGRFRCSDERLNRLQENILRSQKGNMISIPTDCPQRERTGWTGDVQVYLRTGCFEQDLEEFIRHWLKDMECEQLEDGQIPHIVPCMPSHDIMKPPGIKGVSSAGWSDAAVIVPWRLYEAYGDVRILKECFQMMKRYMDATECMACELPDGFDQMEKERQEWQKYLWNTGFQYGDWLMPSIQMSGKSIFEVVAATGYVMATLYYAMTTDIMHQVCKVLGEKKLEQYYLELNKNIKKAFVKEYMNEDGTMKKDYQGVYVVALAVGCVPENRKKAAVRRLEELIRKNGNRLDTGFLSVEYLLPVLHENGLGELANQLLFQEQCPSWLYEVKMGATTMWEYWNGYAEDGTPKDCSMNHFAFGCVGEYLFNTVLGIRPLCPGYQEIRIEPDTACGLQWAEGSYETIWGTVKLAWKKEWGKIALDLVIPPNISAEIIMEGKRQTVTCGTYHMIFEEKTNEAGI